MSSDAVFKLGHIDTRRSIVFVYTAEALWVWPILWRHYLLRLCSDLSSARAGSVNPPPCVCENLQGSWCAVQLHNCSPQAVLQPKNREGIKLTRSVIKFCVIKSFDCLTSKVVCHRVAVNYQACLWHSELHSVMPIKLPDKAKLTQS